MKQNYFHNTSITSQCSQLLKYQNFVYKIAKISVDLILMIFGNTETSPWYITLLHILNHLVNNNGKIAYGVPTTCVIIFAYVLIQWPKSKKENFLGNQDLFYEMKKFASKKLVKIKISLFKIGWNSIGLICKPEFKAFLIKIRNISPKLKKYSHTNWKKIELLKLLFRFEFL